MPRSGLNSISKTQIALEYAYWLRDVHPSISVAWVKANNTGIFLESCEQIALQCGIFEHRGTAKNSLLLLKGWMEDNNHNKWLVILDGVDANFQPASLSTYLPDSDHVTFLVTTRSMMLELTQDPNLQPPQSQYQLVLWVPSRPRNYSTQSKHKSALTTADFFIHGVGRPWLSAKPPP